MKRLIISFLIILMINMNCLLSYAEADDIISDGVFSYIIKEDKTAVIVSCSDVDSSELTVPESLGGYKVTEINGGAFSKTLKCEGFKSNNQLFRTEDGVLYKGKTLVCYPAGRKNTDFAVPTGTERIEKYAFVGNVFIKQIDMGDVTAVPEGCFAGCSSLELVDFENVLQIGDSAFAFCGNLTECGFSDKLERIGDGAFYGCESIKELKLGDEIEYIGKMAFEKCLSVTDICIPAKIKSVESWIYSINPELKSVSVSEDNSYYKVVDNILYTTDSPGRLVFCPCGDYVSEIVVPAGVGIIGKGAFENHRYLKNISLPDSVDTVESHAFYKCTALEGVDFGNGVKTIGDYAFFGCEKLGNVRLLSSVKDIGEGAFKNCPGVKLVVADGSQGYMYAESDNIKYEIDATQEAVIPAYWADRYIEWSEKNGITSVVEDYSVVLNREGCSWLMVNFYEYITGETAAIPENPFLDTNSPAVGKAYGLGILSGVGGGYFNPSAPITRQELCVCLVKLVTVLDGEVSGNGDTAVFRDSEKIAPWAIEYVDRAYEGGIITGFPDGRIAPEENATIEETLVMLYNAAAIVEGK